jgi:type III pantothenate kinase
MSRSLTLLVADVGNSSTSVGLFAGGRIRSTERVETAKLSVSGLRRRLTYLARDHQVQGAALVSVVPAINPLLTEALQAFSPTPVLRVHHQLRLGAPLTYPQPASIGEDRLANVAGAVARYGTPVIVVDIGTATTFDIIQRRKGYTGGIIAPGPALMLEYLAEKTALLPRLDLTPVRHMVGKSTEEAMRIGALHGYRGMVKEITRHLMTSLKKKSITLCATGGYARWVLKGMDLPFVYDRDLTLYGVAMIHQQNASDFGS